MGYAVGIIGGDTRQYYLAQLLLKESEVCKVNVFCVKNQDDLNGKVFCCESLEELIFDSDVIFGGIPLCKEGNILNVKDQCFRDIRTEELIKGFKKVCGVCKNIGQSKVFIAGAIHSVVYSELSLLGVNVFDVLARDDFAVLNAVPTAEGAVQFAMENTTYTLSGGKALVIGSGRIGKVLAHKLDRLDMKVTVTSRRASERALWYAYGIDSCDYGEEFKALLHNVDIIFNTVPMPLITKNDALCLNDDVLIIDLATNCDFFALCDDNEITKKYNVIKLPGLPGKVAPFTSASYIKTVMVNILSEIGG